MNSQKRYSQIDILYTIGIFCVVLGHSHPSDWSAFRGTLFESIIVFIYTFHMPLFFFIAGFLFMNSHALERDGYKNWIKNKAVKLLVPYIVLSLIVLLPKYYVEYHAWITVNSLIEAIFIPRKGVWGHFWFIPILLLCYAVFGMWKMYVNKNNEFFMLCVATAVSLVVYFLPFTTLWFGISDLKEACIFFCMGMILRCLEPHKMRIPREIKIFVGGV